MKSRILVDTQAFLEVRAGKKLSVRARKTFSDENSELHLSVASVWEIQIKLGLRKLELDVPLRELMDRALSSGHIQLLPIEVDHIYKLDSLPLHHRDPFDRLLIAQALSEKMKVLGSDEAFDAYGVDRIW